MIRNSSRAKHAYVVVRRHEVAAAARWLLSEFDAADFVTLITDTPEERAELSSNAQALGKLFQKMGKRRRDGEVFDARVPRDLAEWFGAFSQWGPCAFYGAQWWRVAAACAAAVDRTVGRKRLNHVQLANRAGGLIPWDDRHIRRLKARVRSDERFEEILRRSGGSIIGGAS